MKRLEYFLLVMIFLCASCAKDQWFDPPGLLPGNSSQFNLISPQIKIAVVSDIHYMDLSLMPDDPENNMDFRKKMSMDRKLIELSDPIFERVISELIAEKPDILLITGDLSFEGEKLSHETVSVSLQELENEGIKVYVIPGNNDIDNPEAKDYSGDVTTPTDYITPGQFAEIYGAFGYIGDEIIARDGNSLSYICQPYKGLWILGIDANEITSSGRHAIKAATMAWILEKMTEARENGIIVLAMMHYGIIEHYTGQDKLEKLIKNSQGNAIDLMNAGLRVIFTGHYHANDIAEFTNDGKTLYDIQTGSLVTPLSPYRIMKLDDNFIKIETRYVSSVNAEMPEGMNFLEYSDALITPRINSFFSFYLPLLFGLTVEQSEFAAPFLSNGYKAYFAGDEKISPEERNSIEVLSNEPYSPVLEVLKSFWRDLPPQDNKIHIKLK